MMESIILPLISALFGGAFVALINYFKDKRRLGAEIGIRDAQVKKLEAETSKIRAETDSISGKIEGVKSEQLKTERDVKFQEKEIYWVKSLIALFMSDYERMFLQNIASDEPFDVEIESGSTFDWELRHLLTLNLLDRHPGKGMRSLIKQKKGNVKEHLYITERGRKYLKILEEANSENIKTVNG